MIHKLMDIFGRKGNGAASTPPNEPGQSVGKDKQVSDPKTDVDTKTTAPVVETKQVDSKSQINVKNASPESDSTVTNETLLYYLKSTSKSSRDRDNCFGCKVTASVMLFSVVMFSLGCIQMKRKEILSEQFSLKGRRRTSRMLRVIQLSLAGTWLAFMYGEWLAPRPKEEKS